MSNQVSASDSLSVALAIEALEEEHGIPTAVFLQSFEEHGEIPEDTVAEWLFLVARKKALEDLSRDVRSNYLNSVSHAESAFSLLTPPQGVVEDRELLAA